MRVVIELSDEAYARFTALGGEAWLNERLRSGERKEAQEWLRSALLAGPRYVVELYNAAEAEGISADRLRRARRRMGLPRARRGWGKGARLYWGLPGTLPDKYGDQAGRKPTRKWT